jgi:CMP-N-acetylneuraminic acid synthetase
MTATPHVLGLLPARGGSKGIPGKNLLELAGKPLLAWTGTALLEAESLNRRICSTDSEDIAAFARGIGLEVPFIRPGELAEDHSGVIDVVLHALDYYSNNEEQFSHVVLLQATSPTVTAQDVDAAVHMALSENADTVITGFRASSTHPSLMYTVDESGDVQWLLTEGTHAKRRQELAEVFIRTGLVYVVKTEVVREKHSMYGERICSMEIPQNRALAIDDEFDLAWAKFLFECDEPNK